MQEYLQWTLFYEARDFTPAELTEAIKNLSTPIEETLELLRALKQTNLYRLMTINNESRELNEYRIQHFHLTEIFSTFFSSCYLGLMKPQPEHYRRALDISQYPANSCVYIDDRPMNLEVARILGMKTILFKHTGQLKEDLLELGVSVTSAL